MKLITPLLILLPVACAAQTTWEVEAGGSTAPGQTPPYYDPMELTIHVGDHVHWTTASGTHNVYGELDMFPDNPEGFSSGEPTSDLDFTYTFTIPGVYHYHCTQQGHSTTQHGTITVLQAEHVEEVTPLGDLAMYPVPATDHLVIELDGASLRTAQLLAVDGRVLQSVALAAGRRNEIALNGLSSGRYLLRLIDLNGRSLVRPFVRQ